MPRLQGLEILVEIKRSRVFGEEGMRTTALCRVLTTAGSLTASWSFPRGRPCGAGSPLPTLPGNGLRTSGRARGCRGQSQAWAWACLGPSPTYRGGGVSAAEGHWQISRLSLGSHVSFSKQKPKRVNRVERRTAEWRKGTWGSGASFLSTLRRFWNPLVIREVLSSMNKLGLCYPLTGTEISLPTQNWILSHVTAQRLCIPLHFALNCVVRHHLKIRVEGDPQMAQRFSACLWPRARS